MYPLQYQRQPDLAATPLNETQRPCPSEGEWLWRQVKPDLYRSSLLELAANHT